MRETSIEPKLHPEADALLTRGIEELRAGRFFECHDTLEEAWRGERSAARAFLKGLVQLAVGCYHLQDGNLRGAESQLEMARGNLDAYGDRYLGVRLAGLDGRIAVAVTKIRTGQGQAAIVLVSAIPSRDPS